MITVPYYTSDRGARLNCHLRGRARDHLGLKLLGIVAVILAITLTPKLLLLQQVSYEVPTDKAFCPALPLSAVTGKANLAQTAT